MKEDQSTWVTAQECHGTKGNKAVNIDELMRAMKHWEA